MGYVVRMPQLGMTMEEGVVVEWTAEEGAEFDEGDVIAVVESEKTTNDVEAREPGTIIERFVDFEEPVGPGDPIAYVGDAGEDVPQDTEGLAEADAEADTGGTDGSATESDSAPEAEVAGTVADTAADDAKVSPRARSYARERDIDPDRLATLSGSGPDGAVVEADIVEAAEELTAPASSEPDRATANPELTRRAVPSVDGRDIYETRGGSGLRRTIANRMTESAKAPQVTLNQRVRVDPLLEIKERLAEDRGLDLSITDFLLAALTRALAEHPGLNGIYEEGTHKLARNINIGIAVDRDDGLVTPVIEGADQRTVTELREERTRLVSLAQSGEYTMEDLSGGTFTVTNLGHFGVESFDPILNPPEVGILGVGTIQSRSDPEGDGAVREIGLSLTFDHRAVDGADGARFLETLDDMLTHPLRLVDFGRTQGSAGPFLETGEGPDGDRIANAQSTGGMQASVRSRRFEWRADEPEERGGDDTAPSPVEQFVGSLSSCLTLTIGHMADRRDVNIDSVDVTAQASPPEGRIDHVDVNVRVVSAAPLEDVETVVQTAERACYVNQAIDGSIDRDIDLTVEQP